MCQQILTNLVVQVVPSNHKYNAKFMTLIFFKSKESWVSCLADNSTKDIFGYFCSMRLRIKIIFGKEITAA